MCFEPLIVKSTNIYEVEENLEFHCDITSCRDVFSVSWYHKLNENDEEVWIGSISPEFPDNPRSFNKKFQGNFNITADTKKVKFALENRDTNIGGVYICKIELPSTSRFCQLSQTFDITEKGKNII